MQRNAEVGEDLPDARQKAGLIERDKLQKRFSVGVRWQEIDLGFHRKVPQFGRLTARLRRLPECAG